MSAVIIPDMPEETYYSHPALSASGAKLLMRSPAHFRWAREHPTYKAAFDLGHYVHAKALGVGADVEIIDAEDWRTKAAQAARDAAREAGRIPMLAKDAAVGDAMVASLRDWLEQARLAPLLTPGRGQPEVSIVWDDPEHGVQRRGRLDWLHEEIAGQPRVIVDLKTTVNADPAAAGRTAAAFDYDMQAAWYVDLVRAATGAAEVEFWHLNVEKEPPHFVSGTRLTWEALERGRARNAEAIRRYLDCLAVDQWPAYPTEIITIDLPAWAYRESA